MIDYAPKLFFGGGGYGGIRFGQYNSVYNGGMDVFYNQLQPRELEGSADYGLGGSFLQFPYSTLGVIIPWASLISKTTVSYDFFGVSYDNYFRIRNADNHRMDLVFGLGYAQVAEKSKIEWDTKYANTTTIGAVIDIDGGTAYEDSMLLKFGIVYKLSRYLDFQMMAKYYITGKDDEGEKLVNPLSMTIGLNLAF
jgi:hypothetical protein